MGDLLSAHMLAMCYKDGFGVEKDERKHDAIMEALSGIEAPDQYYVLQSFLKPMIEELNKKQ